MSYVRISIYLSAEERTYLDSKSKVMGTTKSYAIISMCNKCIQDQIYKSELFTDYLERRKIRDKIARIGCTVAYDPDQYVLLDKAAKEIGVSVSLFISATIYSMLNEENLVVEEVYYAGDKVVDWIIDFANQHKISKARTTKKTFMINDSSYELLQQMAEDTRLSMSLLLNVAIKNLFETIKPDYAECDQDSNQQSEALVEDKETSEKDEHKHIEVAVEDTFIPQPPTEDEMELIKRVAAYYEYITSHNKTDA